MPRKRLIRTSHGRYHVTARVNHKYEFPLPVREVWEIFLTLLGRVDGQLQARVHAFVLMSNHYHLFLSTPLKNLDSIMKYLNREATRKISSRTGLINHIFGARYSWSLTYVNRNDAHVLKYIFRNPAKAGMVKRVEDYPFSTLSGFLREREFPFLHFPEGLHPSQTAEKASILRWLNEPLSKEQDELVRKAVRRKEFQFPVNPSYQSLIDNLPPHPW